MYPPGHVGLTAVLVAPFVYWFRLAGRERTAAECLVVAIALSLLPDVDALLPGLVHRGVTHTLLAAVVAGVVVAALVRPDGASPLALADERVTVSACIGAAGVVSHLAGDIITPMGIQPLFPLRQTLYTLDIVQASSPAANSLLLIAGGIAVTLTYGVQPAETDTDDAADESTLSPVPSSRR